MSKNPVSSNPINTNVNNQIGIISINYAPVNALSQSVRQGLVEAIEKFESNNDVKVIIIRCEGKTYIAGADIKEFGKPPTEPFLPDVVNRIENCTKPVVTSLFGTSLGGGFEVALACHYRIALNIAKVGLPEVNLGLIPGAGGTQRLMRLVGPGMALDFITSGKHVSAQSLSSSDIFDELVDATSTEALDSATFKFSENLIETNRLTPRKVGDRKVDVAGFDWNEAKKNIVKKARGKQAPVVAFNVLEKTVDLSIQEGMAFEREQFLVLRDSEQSAALRHAFSAEKLAGKISIDASPNDIQNVGVIGGGNMGSGISTAFLSAGFNVCLIERDDNALNVGMERIKSNYTHNVKRGRMTEDKAQQQLSLLSGATEYNALSGCDLILEAVFEDIEVKKTLFSDVEKVCKPAAILATNTSYLDINDIAHSLSRPEHLVGMHFFSPANIMKLLEVVKADNTAEHVIATAMNVGKKLKKVSVLVGVCFGFAGNRMYTRYGREVQQMLLEGASVEQVDNALTAWGFAMGPLAVQDLSGIDIGHSARSAQPFPKHDKGYFRAAAAMVEAGRLGRKTSAGFYNYQNGVKHYAVEVDSILKDTASNLVITQHTFSDEEIVHRALFALISEGLALLKEGIVQRVSDIDVIWLHGYGFPRYKGGPMFQAQQLGQVQVEQHLAKLRDEFGEDIWPLLDTSVIN